ncbi:hypothetical protein BDA99DRAFT_538506 [Phascolomyces articulosus]|uniref:CID domain-containing protein n=1 Tax=Phascolomyces articulosus TaxID=60185 RepID=A0AAD5PCK6_9FUNG|nr:hypothetical protein BDA99DRAFT_538506 [Phascolomyces articulosus]
MDPYGRPPPHRPPRPPPGHFTARPSRPPPPPHATENNKHNGGYDPNEPYALSAAYDNVKRVMLTPYVDDTNPDRIVEKDLDDFKFILQMIMQECSRTNIESGKTWIFKHCYEPQHMEVIADLWLTLSQSRNSFMERLHLIYLANDILFHSDRRQLHWMKDAILPRLVPLLRYTYHYNGVSNEMRGKVIKVISIWNDKHFFDSKTIESIKEKVLVPPPPPGPITPYDVNPTLLQTSPPLRPHMAPPPPMPAPHFNPGFRPPFPPPPGGYPYPPRPHMRPPPPMAPAGPPPPGVMNPHLPPRPLMMNMHPRAPPPPPSMIPPQYNAPTIGEPHNDQQELPPVPASPPPILEKQYHELPAGLMVPIVEKNDEPAYTELDPTQIQALPTTYPSPSDELQKVVDEFYEGLDLKEQKSDGGFEEQTESKLDRGGWEPGYLDSYYESLKQKRRGQAPRRRQHEESSRSPSRGKRRYRERRHSRDRSRSRSRSYSPDERGRSMERRYSRSHGHRYHRSRSHSPYSRSRSRDSYRSSRSRSRSPHRQSMSRSEPHYKHRSRSISRSPPPPSTYHQGGWYGPGGNTSRYGPRSGLGGMPSEDHTTGRFMGRNDSYQNQKVCYNCSKPGHFARDCPESSYNNHPQRY